MRRRQSCETVLIGKNVLIREGIAKILHAANFRIPVSASSPEELPSSLQAEKLMFLIVHTGDGFNLAIAQIGFVKDRYPDARIAIVSDNYRPVDLASAFRAGANGYFVNVNSCDAFIKSVELVTMGETVFPPAFLSFALDANRANAKRRSPANANKPSSPLRRTRSCRSSLHEKRLFYPASSKAIPTSALPERSISPRPP
ncbi:DNA-binding NarL/FixJ family response regulator [Bradyrhizobium sp. GM24.11]